VDETLFWTKVTALGQIAGAVATFVAVLVALWIARTERRASIKVSAGLRLTFAGDGSPFEDKILIRITNHGLRPVRVSAVGWRTGWVKFGPKWLKFQHAVQKFDHPVSLMTSPTPPPFDLGPGQEVSLLLSPDPFKKPGELRDTFFNRRLPLRRKVSPTKICVVVSMVAAKASVTRVEKGLEKFLATGVIADGADKANKAANRKEARA
jgi:hypothetical protein